MHIFMTYNICVTTNYMKYSYGLKVQAGMVQYHTEKQKQRMLACERQFV